MIRPFLFLLIFLPLLSCTIEEPVPDDVRFIGRWNVIEKVHVHGTIVSETESTENRGIIEFKSRHRALLESPLEQQDLDWESDEYSIELDDSYNYLPYCLKYDYSFINPDSVNLFNSKKETEVITSFDGTYILTTITETTWMLSRV